MYQFPKMKVSKRTLSKTQRFAAQGSKDLPEDFKMYGKVPP